LALLGGLLCGNPYYLFFALPLPLGSIIALWPSDLTLPQQILFSVLPFLLPTITYPALFLR
jgi:hypothetical protein